MRIIVFIITAAIQLAAAAAGFLLLLLGLNGYSGQQAQPSLIFYIILSAGSAAGLGVASAFTAKRFAEKKSLGSLGGAALAVVAFSAIGAVVLIALFFVALIIAEVVRGMR